MKSRQEIAAVAIDYEDDMLILGGILDSSSKPYMLFYQAKGGVLYIPGNSVGGENEKRCSYHQKKYSCLSHILLP